jgi:CDP-2,3-bis-(O-geranylgeranyl)-sn-glycerol synthase
MDFLLVLRLLALLAVANTTPLLTHLVISRGMPLDGGAIFADGRRLLGQSKTIPGFVSGIVATTLLAPLADFSMAIGALAGTTAMAGDLFASFVKRRLAVAPGGRATGLDQIPEALLPAVAVSLFLPLTIVELASVVLAFFVGEIVLARVFFALHLRERPY